MKYFDKGKIALLFGKVSSSVSIILLSPYAVHMHRQCKIPYDNREIEDVKYIRYVYAGQGAGIYSVYKFIFFY